MIQPRNKKIFLLSLLFLGLFFGGLFLVGTSVSAQSIADTSSTLNQGVGVIAEPLGLPTTDIRTIIARIIRVFLGLLGIIALVLMIYAGFIWMTAGGNEDKIAQAKKILVNATIGLVIILSSYAIVSFVINKLLTATAGYPDHCFNNVTVPDGDETGVNCGGSCPACSTDTTCTNPPCNLGSSVFSINSLPAGGNVCVRNVRLAIVFSEAVNINTVNSSTVSVTMKGYPDTEIDGVWQLASENNVAVFVPSGSCPDSGSGCLEPTTGYVLDVIDSVAIDKIRGIENANHNRKLSCSNGKCGSVEFMTGENVDRTAPTVTLDVISPFQSGRTMSAKIIFTDDSGLQNAAFYAGSYFIGSNNLTGCQKNSSTTIDWNTTGMLGMINTKGVGLDWAGQSAEDNKNVDLQPDHCFNTIQDLDQNETGLNCGVNSGCGVCGGGKCTADEQCASGYCEIISPATEGVCVDKMKITDVSPLSGAAGTFVTIAGNYFGNNTGKVYFSKVASPDKANLNDWQEASLASCGVSTWTSQQIIVEVPANNAVSGPIMVETASTTGNDNIVRKFFDTTNDGWGRNIGNFVISNQVRPGLCPINPNNGAPNEAVNLFGKNFGTAGGQIFFGSQQAAQNSWSDTAIQTKVPSLDKGSLGVSVAPFGKLESNSVYFYVNSVVGADDPVISDISPRKGAKGEYVTITGSKFGNTQGIVYFKKDGNTFYGDNVFPTDCAGVTWSDNQIIVKFPSSTSAVLGDYTVWISTNDSKISAPASQKFTVESGVPAPGICRIDPDNGPVPFAANSNIKIYGEYFDAGVDVVKKCKYGDSVRGKLSCTQNSDCPISYLTISDAVAISRGVYGYTLDTRNVYTLPDGYCQTKSGASYFDPSTYKPCRTNSVCGTGNLCFISNNPNSLQRIATNTCDIVSVPTVSTVYFWQSGASSTARDGRVAATDITSVANSLINLRPPTTTQSGPVAAYRPADNKIGNGVKFTVNDCVKNNKTCNQSGYQCCDSGDEQGVCIPSGDMCKGQTRSTGYVWRFSTRDIPVPLTVVERCDAETEAGRALPTPSPSTIWNRVGYPNDDQSNVCRNALIEIEFSRGDVATIPAGSVLVHKCTPDSVDLTNNSCVLDSSVEVVDQNGASNSFSPSASTQLGAATGRDYLELTPRYNNGKWEDNTWYRVVLKNDIIAGSGTSTIRLSSTKTCDVNGDGKITTADNSAYCFFFKTGSSDCRLKEVVITPYSYWTNYLESPLKYHLVGGDIYDLFYSGHGLSTQRCIMMNVSGYDWHWNSSNTDYSNIYSNTTSVKNVQISTLRNTVGVGLTNPTNAVNIIATASTGTISHTNSSPLTIDLSDPKVVDYWPNCLETCTDAAIGARFNLTMSNNNLNSAVHLYKCLDENCLSTEIVPLHSARLDDVKSFTELVVVPSSTVLEPQTIYQVVLSNKHAIEPNNPLASSDVLWSAAKFGDPTTYSKPLNQQFTWRFRTKKEACKIDRVEVAPKVFNASSLTAKTIYSAQPYSASDNCSVSGQKLNAANTDWNWRSSDTNIAVTAGFISKGYNPFCTASCIRKGSDIPSGSVDRNLRVCGNGIVEAGEDCDYGTASDPVGPNATLGCGLNCLLMGNSNVTTTVSSTNLHLCGDGTASINDGEECDPNSAVTSTRINCTNNCLHSGSKLSTGATEISASICGNNYVGAGEDCDLGKVASSTDPDSSMGCSANCLHQGTRLSTKWCNDHKTDRGGFTVSSYNTYCAEAYSQCGDGVENPDEDPGCDLGNNTHAANCNEFCLLKTGDATADYTSVNDCSSTGRGGCGDNEQHIGSSLLYSDPSVCGDGIVGLGEDAWCETNLTITKTNNYTNPWALATGIGNGVPSGDPIAQRANIIARALNNVLPDVVKEGSGQFVIKCGYQSDAECQLANGNDARYGVANNTCCYARPQLTDVFPGATTTVSTGVTTPNSTTDICPNTYISAHFDQQIDSRTLSGNFIIARGVAGSTCAAGEEVVSSQIIALNSGSSHAKWYVSLWKKMVFFFKSLIGAETQARPTNVSVQTWCAGQDIGSAEVVNDTYGSGSKIKVNLKKPLAFNTDYAIILGSEIKDTKGIRIGQASNGKNMFWRFSTGGEICEVNSVIVNPDQYYFSVAGSTTTLEAIASNSDDNEIQSIPGFYSWEIIWAPQTNNFVSLIDTTSTFNLITAKNQNGEIDIRASASIIDNQYTSQKDLVATGRTHIVVFLCENPWPPKDLILDNTHNIIFPYEDKVGNNDGYSFASNTFDGTPIISSVGGGYFNFATYYCADNGSTGSYDDLPYLKPVVQVSDGLNIEKVCSQTGNDCSDDPSCDDGYEINGKVYYLPNMEACADPANNYLPPTGVDGYVSCSGGSGGREVVNCAKGTCAWISIIGTKQTVVELTDNNCVARAKEGSALKRFLFTNERNSDAIGVQVFSNTEHLTAQQWFMNSKEFGGQGFTGSLQSLKVNGYDAVSDGNNIYVNALNFSSADVNPVSGNLYTNIYLFSINSDAKAETRNVYDQIIKNLTFNTNLTNYGYCGASIANPNASTTCITDFDCPTGEICSVQIDKLKRNYQRMSDLSSINKMLSGYYSKNNSYPDLKEGTYLSGQTISTWPSWSVLGNAVGSSFPTDPVNKLAPSGSCSSSTGRYCLTDGNCPTGETCVLHDATTGWSTADRRFSFACSSSSLAYRYIFSSTDGYNVYSGDEDDGLDILNGGNLVGDFFTSPARFIHSGGSMCLPGETITTMKSGRCGDGKLNLNLSEDCDPPGYKLYEDDCVGSVKNLRVCDSLCKWVASTTPCSNFSKCGNGIVEFGEECDDKELNGKYNHCNSTCDGKTSAYCGDGVLQREYEFCDTVSNKCTFASVAGLLPGTGPCQTYDFNQNRSCKSDCSDFGGYCGDGVVDSNFGERCETNQGCSISGASGFRICKGCLKFDEKAKAAWRFDEILNATGGRTIVYKDSQGNIPIVCSGNYCPSTVVGGKYDGALSLNNDTSLFIDSDVLSQAKEFTYSVWIKPLSASDNDSGIIERSIVERSVNGSEMAFGLKYKPDTAITSNEKSVYLVSSVNSAIRVIATSTQIVDYDKWTHIAVSYDGGVIKLYINGRLDSATSFILPETALSTRIGTGSIPGNFLPRHFAGQIDELSFYDQVLTAAEIKDLYDTNWLCTASTTPDQNPVTKKATCGDGNIDTLNDKGIREECDDGASLNGVECQNGYNKSCTYCSADCSAKITKNAIGYCGDGIINGAEVCETDTNNDIYSAAPKVGKTSTSNNTLHNGYKVLGCSEEKNFKLNSLTIAATSNWSTLLLDPVTNSTTMNAILDGLYTYKKGNKICANSCQSLQDGCVECGLVEKGGSIIQGVLINVLEPNTNIASKYKMPLYSDDNVDSWKRGSMGLSFSLDGWLVGTNMNTHGVAFDNSISSEKFVLKAYGGTQTALVNTNPVCSDASTDSRNFHYQLNFNNDSQSKHAVDLEVVSSTGQYNQVLSPIIRLESFSTSSSNVSIQARPKDLRIVVRWIGNLEVLGGFKLPTGNPAIVEGGSFPTAIGVNYYNAPKYLSIWHHGFSTTEGGGINVEAFTVDTDTLLSSNYIFYVKLPNSVGNYYNSKVQVEIYVPESESISDNTSDRSWRHFSRPVKVYYLNNANRSDNPAAKYWHVFNIKKGVGNDASVSDNVQEVNYIRTAESDLKFDFSSY